MCWRGKKKKKRKESFCVWSADYSVRREINRIDWKRSDVEFTTKGGIFLFFFFRGTMRCVNNNKIRKKIRKKEAKKSKRRDCKFWLRKVKRKWEEEEEGKENGQSEKANRCRLIKMFATGVTVRDQSSSLSLIKLAIGKFERRFNGSQKREAR